MHSSTPPITAQQPLSPCQLPGWDPSLGALCQAWGVGSIPQGVGGTRLVAMLIVPGTIMLFCLTDDIQLLLSAVLNTMNRAMLSVCYCHGHLRHALQSC